MMKFTLTIISILASVLLLLPGLCIAAFEPVSDSPLLQGGIASSLFPASPLVISSNPACLGLLEGSGLAASASRPFGLDRLDRTSIAGNWNFSSFITGAALSLSGDGRYTEGTATAGCAYRLRRGVVLGGNISMKNLYISGYGRAVGYTADAGVLWSPAAGLYFTALVRSLLRTDLGSSGDPASPRSLEMGIGVVPVERVFIGIGASRQEGFDTELCVHTMFSPASCFSLGAGLKTDPARFWGALWLSVSSVSLEYGYGEHASLPGTHSIAVCWGRCGSDPTPLQLQGNDEETEQETAFPIDVNTATEQQLELIPGIGPSKASAIAAWIRHNGPVSDIQDLENVPGIGQSLLAVLKEYLVVH